jgi:hypothetical protein
MKQFCNLFLKWRSKINTKFAKKGLDPTKIYKISSGQWVVFLEQRSNPDFVSLSEANSKPSMLGQEDTEKKVIGLPML